MEVDKSQDWSRFRNYVQICTKICAKAIYVDIQNSVELPNLCLIKQFSIKDK